LKFLPLRPESFRATVDQKFNFIHFQDRLEAEKCNEEGRKFRSHLPQIRTIMETK